MLPKKPDRFEIGGSRSTNQKRSMWAICRGTSETRSVTRSINVVDEDVAIFNKLHDKGVVLTAQMVPNDPTEDFMKLLK